MTVVENLARFVKNATYEDLSPEAIEQLKIRTLDSLGCALGAMGAPPIVAIHNMVRDLDCSQQCTLILGGRAAPDRAAFYNSALIRYLDFNDSYLAKNETCHPSDNIGAVLAASEMAHRNGRDFLLALAIAYQIQCRLSDEAPVRAVGFDHTVQGAYAAAAGVAKALDLPMEKIANAVAISGTANNALRVTRTGRLSNWKGLAYPYTAASAMQAALLASYGITGPLEVFEGNKGFMDTIAGPFRVDWATENLESVRKTIIKKYNAEIHSQSILEGILELQSEYHLSADIIESIDIETFDVAYNIIGGGEEGDKKTIRTKEEADHSLPYMIAVAFLDGQVMPQQYAPDRIAKPDVQMLLQKITICPSKELSMRFPQEMPSTISLRLKNGEILTLYKSDYEGFYTHPMALKSVVHKFQFLADKAIDRHQQAQLIEAVLHLEELSIGEFVRLLAEAHSPVEASYSI